MVLNFLQLKNFRLHINSSLNFSENLNYIVGGNGQGKTSILEAIYYLATTKSLLTSSDVEALNFNKNEFEIYGEFTGLTKDKVKVNLSREIGKKNIFLNNKQVYKYSSIYGRFPVVTLTQSDHYITMGSPAERRKFIDSVISQSSSTYLKILIDYNKTLRQRSNLLSQLRESYNNELQEQLNAWTESLIKFGAQLINHRNIFIKNFNEFVQQAYNKIMEKEEIPYINYKFLNKTNIDEIKTDLAGEIKLKRSDELRRATNLVGPHRDDFTFYINDMELRKYGSQGQHKTFQIALRFGEFFYLKDKLGRKPLFLMDDIFGELDTQRSKKISEYLKEVGQAFITMTDFTNFDYLYRGSEDCLIYVDNGNCKYEN